MNKFPKPSAYLNLAYVLLFQSPWLKWFFLIGLVLSGVGSSLTYLWDSEVFKLVAISGGVFIFTAVFIMMVTLPGQMLAINSSKTISILPGIKKLSLVTSFLFSFMCALSLTVFTVLMNKPVVFTHLFSAIFFVISFMLAFSTVIAQRWQWAQFFVFISTAVIPFVLGWLQSVSVLVGLGFNILLWCGFITWWRVWRPTRFFKNFVGMNHLQMRAFHERNRYSAEQGKVIASIASGLRSFEKPLINRLDAITAYLLGAKLGWSGGVKSSILAMALFGVIAFLLYLLLGAEKVIGFFGNTSYIFIFLMYLSVSQMMLVTTYRNMPRIWLITQGSRSTILKLIEKIYFSTVAAAVLPVFIIHLTLCFIFPHIFFDPLFALILFLFGIQILVVNFYIGIIVYVYPSTGISWMNWGNITIAVLSMMTVSIVRSMWVDSRAQIILYAMIVIVAAFISVLFLRMYTTRIWPKANFVRPTT